MKQILVIIYFLSTYALIAQSNYDWWNSIHQWDGTTPWHRMQKSTPWYMGSNALPVPELRNGLVDSLWSIQLSNDVHWANNDFTYNNFAQINIPLNKVASFHVWWIPHEYFTTDTVIRDLRMGRTREAQGWNTGDVYVSTQIQLVKNHTILPDLSLGSSLKTALGSILGDSRFTDAPAYYFDINFGKTYTFTSNHLRLRPQGMMGLYVYQTNRDDQFQNDAFLWGLGLQIFNNKWDFRIQSAEYIGYLADLDRPTLLRLRTSKKWKLWEIFGRYQVGNPSYPFQTLSIGVIRNL